MIEKLHYEVIEYYFRQGEVLHNLNGSDCSVLMVLNRSDLLEIDMDSIRKEYGINHNEAPKESGTDEEPEL